MAYEKFRKKIVNLQSDVNLFKTEFLDRDDFKKFADNLRSNVDKWFEICITGYFSETIRKPLEKLLEPSMIETSRHVVRIICPHLNVKKVRDKKNLQALRKLAKAGALIKMNDRLHARFLVAYDPPIMQEKGDPYHGLLLIGSFDFNTECIGRERYDAGVRTMNPDLVRSAVKLFDQIWVEPESKKIGEPSVADFFGEKPKAN